MGEACRGATDGVGDGVTDGVGVGVASSVGGRRRASPRASSVAVGVGVASSSSSVELSRGVPPNRPVWRLESPIWLPKIASSEAVTTVAPMTAAIRPVMTVMRHGKRRRWLLRLAQAERVVLACPSA